MIKSMTGFGRVTGKISDRFNTSITAKTVNHRYLEISVRLPEQIWELEPVVRAVASETLSRGKVDLSVRLHRTSDPEYVARVNERVASAVIPQLRSLLVQFGVEEAFSPSDLLRIPDLLQVDPVEQEWSDEEQRSFRELVREALIQLDQMRRQEGDGLRADLESRLARVDHLSTQVGDERAAITREVMEGFRQRAADLAKTAGLEVPEERIAQEVILMMEKMDVSEELTRLSLHLKQFRSAMDGEEPAGKKLDFLAQEMLREINTLGQKSRASAIRTAVVELKTEVERIREQVQNVE